MSARLPTKSAKSKTGRKKASYSTTSRPSCKARNTSDFWLIYWFTAIWIQKIDIVAGLDARGFIIGAALAYQLNVGFVPIRKKGKLPFETVSQSYALEYGEAAVEIHTDAVKPGSRVLLVDDLVATGGTMLAGLELIRKLGGEIVEAAAILEFTDLQGGKNIRASGAPLFTLLQNEGCMKG